MTAGRIYAYSAPGYDAEWHRTVGGTTTTGRGKLKVGWTGREDSKVRVKEQTGTVYPGDDDIVIHLDEPAVREDGSAFRDHDVHHILDAAGVTRTQEVVEATLDEVKAALTAVRTRRPYDPDRTEDFGMRPEQEAAVEQTASYFADHADEERAPRFLWNAKMRFGKTFTTYQLAKKMDWKRVLVLTYKPAVRNSWRDDLASHVDFAGWEFADRENPADPDTGNPLVWFASFQDLLGTTGEGDVKEHNVDLHLIEWDCVVLDEYHFGAWQGAAKEVCDPVGKTPKNVEMAAEKAANDAADHADDVADLAESGTPRLIAATPEAVGLEADLDSEQLRLTGKHYLYLSGTPFRALTDGEFTEDAIYNWTYPDEQRAKAAWDTDPQNDTNRNPYRELPEMQMYTYALSEMASLAIDQGEDGLFDLSGYFEATKTGSEYHFTDPGRITEFLNMLNGSLTQTAKDKLLDGRNLPFPYTDGRFTKAVDHTVWFLPTVASCHAMKAALESHPKFRDFLIHVAAGSSAKMGAEAKAPVDKMLNRATTNAKRTITLSCGKLMTGVTVPQWGAILILRSLKSPESYFQSAFRVQSPWAVKGADGGREVKKDTCFVFDFDPNRALSLVYQYGTKLAGNSTTTAPSDVLDELVKYLPIFAFDGGRMDRIDANAVMDWGTAGAGATMLAKRWGSPRLIDLSEEVLRKLLGNEDLVERLQQMEDFRSLREDANKIISQSQKLKDAKKQRAAKENDGDLDDEEAAARKAKREQVATLRDKLLKFIQRLPVFMYLTDHREKALTDVITTHDSQLFERVTGLTLDDFRQLSEVGVFSPGHMNEAIWQFRLFERHSLHYLGVALGGTDDTVGLWSETVPASAMDEVAQEGTGRPVQPEARLLELIETGALDANAVLLPALTGARKAVVLDTGYLTIDGTAYPGVQAAADASAGSAVEEPWEFWSVEGYGTLAELAELVSS